jgi:hypothetical protein
MDKTGRYILVTDGEKVFLLTFVIENTHGTCENMENAGVSNGDRDWAVQNRTTIRNLRKLSNSLKSSSGERLAILAFSDGYLADREDPLSKANFRSKSGLFRAAVIA